MNFYIGKTSLQPIGSINREIGYEYPNFQLFDVQTGLYIKAINGVNVARTFHNDVNRACPYNNEQSCGVFFQKMISLGSLSFAGEPPKSFTLTDGLRDYDIPVAFAPVPARPPTLYCDEVANSYQNFTIIHKGYNLCLFSRGTTGLIRLRSFLYPYVSPGDPGFISMQEEVDQALAALAAHPEINSLIFDLLSNGGGEENTPFLRAFMPNAFGELHIKYRKVLELDDSNLRNELFYGVDAAENWFQDLLSSGVYDQTPYGRYLPIRTNFCRASGTCGDGMIIVVGFFWTTFG